MSRNYGSDNKSALEAKEEAQRIAFAPFVFWGIIFLQTFSLKFLAIFAMWNVDFFAFQKL